MKKRFSKLISCLVLVCTLIINFSPLVVHADPYDGDEAEMFNKFLECNYIARSADEARQKAAFESFSAIVTMLRADGWTDVAISGLLARIDLISAFDPYYTEGDNQLKSYKILIGDSSVLDTATGTWKGFDGSGVQGGVGLLGWTHRKHEAFDSAMQEKVSSSGTKIISQKWYTTHNSGLHDTSYVGDVGSQLAFLFGDASAWQSKFWDICRGYYNTNIKRNVTEMDTIISGRFNPSTYPAYSYANQKVFFSSSSSYPSNADLKGRDSSFYEPVVYVDMEGSFTSLGTGLEGFSNFKSITEDSNLKFTYYEKYWLSKWVEQSCSEAGCTNTYYSHTHGSYQWVEQTRTLGTCEYKGTGLAGVVALVMLDNGTNKDYSDVSFIYDTSVDKSQKYKAVLELGDFSGFMDTTTSTSIATALSNSGYWTDAQLSAFAKLTETDLTTLLESASRDNLSADHLSSLVGWEQNREMEKEEHGWISTLRKVVMMIGIVFTVWVMFIYIAYWFDRLNNFFYIDLLGILTLGHLHITDDERECTYGKSEHNQAGKKTVNHRAILTICLVGLVFGVLVVTGLFYDALAKLVRMAVNFLS